MRTRDWAGTVLIACLVALAAFLRDSIAGPVLAAVVLVCLAVLVLDILKTRTRQPVVAGPQSHQPSSVEASKSSPDERLLRRTPEEIWHLFDGLTDMQAEQVVRPFLGQRMQVSGPVRSVGAWTGGFSQVAVGVTLKASSERFLKGIYLLFRDKKWVPQLAALQERDRITVLGEVVRITRMEIQLDNCQLVESGP